MVRPGGDRLLGIIQVDETYISGKKPGKQGRGAAGKSLVVVMVEAKETEIRRIRLRRVRDASGLSLECAVKEGVKTGSTVQTDGWRDYGQLSEMGYIHEVVRKEAVVRRNLLPRVSLVAALLKRRLLETYQGGIQLSHLDYYLDELTFRLYRRTSGSSCKLFYQVIEQAAAIDPLPCLEIRKGFATA